MLQVRKLGVVIAGRRILRAVDFALPARGVVVLLGPSGTGKSTLLHVLANRAHGFPSGWEVTGELLPEDGAAGFPSIGMVVQSPRLLRASVLDNLVHKWPRRATLTRLEQRAYMGDVLRGLELADLAAALGDNVMDLPLWQQRIVTILSEAFSGCRLLLLDEPTAGLAPVEAAPVVALIRHLGRDRTLLVVMHHVMQSRQMADAVVLLANGVVQETGPGEAFFAAPTTEAGRCFVATGSCPEGAFRDVLGAVEPEPTGGDGAQTPATPPAVRPAAVAPAAIAAGTPDASGPNGAGPAMTGQGPTGFHWLVAGRLGGTPMPGLLHDVDDELDELREAGVTCLLSLTETPFNAARAAAHGLGCHAVAIRDMAAPTLGEAQGLCEFIVHALASGERVAVHCRAGLGRTGTVLACYLLWTQPQLSGVQALAAVRRVNAGWVQSLAQEQFLDEFARWRTARLVHAGAMADPAQTGTACAHSSPTP